MLLDDMNLCRRVFFRVSYFYSLMKKTIVDGCLFKNAKDFFWYLIRVNPLTGCMLSFDYSQHSAAIKKLFFLWSFSVSPVLLAALVFGCGACDGGLFERFSINVKETFGHQDFLTYILSVATPMIYMIYEKYDGLVKSMSNGKQSIVNFNGYGWFGVISLIIVLFSLISYSLLKANSALYENSMLFRINKALWIYVYVFIIYCWYLTILDSITSSFDFADEQSKEQEDARNQFRKRIDRRAGG